MISDIACPFLTREHCAISPLLLTFPCRIDLDQLSKAERRPYFFSNNTIPFCPTTRCTAWAKRAKSQGSVTSSRTPLS